MYRAHLDSLLKYIDEGVKEGATLVYGGKRLPRPGILIHYIDIMFNCINILGFFLEPTVFTDVQDHMMVAKEESFGPVMVVSVFENGSVVTAVCVYKCIMSVVILMVYYVELMLQSLV